MHPYCIYVFDSSTANEAALAVKEGHYQSIIDYHSTKHQHKQPPPSVLPGPQPHMHPQSLPPSQPQHMMGGPPMPAGYPPNPQHHMSGPQPLPGGPPATNMSQQQNLSPQKMRERESKLNRLGQLAQLTTQPPPNITSAPQQRPIPQQHQIPSPHQTQNPQQPQPSQQQQIPLVKSEPSQQPLDPLSSMAAMTECPNMDNYGHTVHHHPPSS